MDQDKFTLEATDRLARIETKLDTLFSAIEDLPTSPATLEQFKAQGARISALESFEGSINQKIAWIGGVFATFGVAIGIAGKYIMDHLSLRLQ
jgi:hypothetical protein